MVCIIGDTDSMHIKKYCGYLKEIGCSYTLIPYLTQTNKLHLVLISIIKIFFKLITNRALSRVVHIHYIGKYALLGLLLGFFRCKVIYSAWGSDVLIDQTRIKVFIIKLCLKSSFAVLGDSKRVEARLKEIYGGVNYIRYCFGVEKKFIERRVDREFRLPNHVVDIIKKNDNVLVSVRNLEKIYRIDLVIDGFRELVKTRKKSVLIVMGHGTLAEELRCKAMDLGEKVIFVGKYQQNQLAHILEFKPIIISAAISDAGLSSTVSECMVWGAICVLSNVADNWLWIERQHDKLLFNSDVESVVDSISYALDLSEDDRSIIMSRQRENLLANNDGLKSTENVVNKCYGQAEAS